MGIEGAAAQKYFQCFSKMLTQYHFEGRTRRPAYDPVNALLNLSYAFLNNEIVSRLSVYSFDLELGFLHGIRYGRKSLSLDLMEEFRPVFVDEFVINLLNKRIFKESDFEVSTEGCLLNIDGLKKFCATYHQYVNDKPCQDNNWRQILDSQIKKFRKTILEGGEYRPYKRK